MNHINNMDIAVIGIAVNLPKAKNKNDFWEALKKGEDFIREIPDKRKKDIEDYLQYTGKSTKPVFEKAAYLEHIDYFDNEFFGIPPKDAKYMDPNQRLFLETAWHTIEDAGYSIEKINGANVGVYVGYVSESDYRNIIIESNLAHISIAVPGNCPPLIAGRISHILNLSGPNMLVNTVCSSSLVAVHLACEAIKNGECDMAIAGGIQLHIFPYRKVRVGVESSNGKTMTFDDASDGTGTGEGVGAVLLKSLTQAKKDKDNIYAIIKGSAVNHDGRSVGVSAPNRAAQENVITKAWRQAGIPVKRISYVEAHGTGTKLGDPIEIAALNNVLSKGNEKKQFCAVGSVKSNIGHLDGAAGVVGFIKAVLCLHNKTLVPTINFNRPNRYIDFCNSAIYVNDRLQVWEAEEEKRVCGVSAFSFSGTNCHIALEESLAEIEKESICSPILLVFTFSAKTEATLKAMAQMYIEFLENSDDCFTNICYSSVEARNHFTYRFAALVCDKNQLTAKLKEYCAGLDCHNMLRQDEILFENVCSQQQLKKRIIAIDNYLNNKTIDWRLFFENGTYKKVSLIPYPFTKTRHWITWSQTKNEKSESAVKVQIIDNKTIPIETVNKEGIVSIINNVLEFDSIDLSLAFSEVGGDSIHAMNIADEINSKYNIHIDPMQILKENSLNDFISYIINHAKAEKIKAAGNECGDMNGYFPLTFQQKRIFLSSKVSKRKIDYNMPYVVELIGDLDITKLKKVLIEISKRHEALRTSFHFINGKPMQKVNEEIILNFEYNESCDKNIDESIESFVRTFDVLEYPLLRYRLIKSDKNKYLFLLDIHHIICDGISTNIIVNEFSKLYDEKKLSEIKMKYSDYIQEELNNHGTEKMEVYWKGVMGDGFTRTNIPYDCISSLKEDYERAVISKKIDENLCKEIENFSKEEKITIFDTLFSCFNILVHTETNQNDIVIGLNISGRHDINLRNTVGLLSNIIPFRNIINEGQTYFEIIRIIKENLQLSYDNQTYPIELLAQKAGIYFGSAIKIAFNMIHIEKPTVDQSIIEFKPYYINQRTIQNDIVWDILSDSSSLTINVNYNKKLYKNKTIENLFVSYLELLKTIRNKGNKQYIDIMRKKSQFHLQEINLCDADFNF